MSTTAKEMVAKHTAFILNLQGDKKTWGQDEHRALIVKGMLDLVNAQGGKPLSDDRRKELRDAMMEYCVEAVAGNASAYRQGLKTADGKAMFPKQDKAAKVISEYV